MERKTIVVLSTRLELIGSAARLAAASVRVGAHDSALAYIGEMISNIKSIADYLEDDKLNGRKIDRSEQRTSKNDTDGSAQAEMRQVSPVQTNNGICETK
jgi:hypothetical protein